MIFTTKSYLGKGSSLELTCKRRFCYIVLAMMYYCYYFDFHLECYVKAVVRFHLIELTPRINIL